MRVLAIDDDEQIRQTVHRLLSRTHEVFTAESASDALFLLTSETFDVILCDVHPGGTDGNELLSRLSTSRRLTPIRETNTADTRPIMG
jgi:CheY-like chemotaxis protein